MAAWFSPRLSTPSLLRSAIPSWFISASIPVNLPLRASRMALTILKERRSFFCEAENPPAKAEASTPAPGFSAPSGFVSICMGFKLISVSITWAARALSRLRIATAVDGFAPRGVRLISKISATLLITRVGFSPFTFSQRSSATVKAQLAWSKSPRSTKVRASFPVEVSGAVNSK